MLRAKTRSFIFPPSVPRHWFVRRGGSLTSQLQKTPEVAELAQAGGSGSAKVKLPGSGKLLGSTRSYADSDGRACPTGTAPPLAPDAKPAEPAAPASWAENSWAVCRIGASR